MPNLDKSFLWKSLIVSLCMLTLVACNNTLTCPVPETPQNEARLTEEDAKELMQKYENDEMAKTKDEYAQQLQETEAQLELELEEMESAFTAEELLAVTDSVEIIGLISMTDIAAAVLMTAANIFEIIDVYKNPKSTTLDKATAISNLVFPPLGFILGMVDMKAHEKVKNKHIKDAQNNTFYLSHLSQYPPNSVEKEDLNKTIDSMKNIFSSPTIIAALVNAKQNISDELLRNDLQLKYASVGNTISEIYARLILRDQLPLLETVINNIAHVLKHENALVSNLSVPESASTIDEYFTPSRFVPCISGNKFVSKYTNVDGKSKECLSPLVEYYMDTIKNVASSGQGNLKDWFDKHKWNRLHTMSHMKKQFVDHSIKTKKQVHQQVCRMYKTKADEFLQSVDGVLEKVGKLEFFKKNNLDSQGRSLDSYCWAIERYNCISATQNCHNRYPAGSVAHNYCYQMANAPDVCQTRLAYSNGCGITTYNPDADQTLINAKNDFSNYVDNIKNQCASSFNAYKIDISSFKSVTDVPDSSVFLGLLYSLKATIVEKALEISKSSTPTVTPSSPTYIPDYDSLSANQKSCIGDKSFDMLIKTNNFFDTVAKAKNTCPSVCNSENRTWNGDWFYSTILSHSVKINDKSYCYCQHNFDKTINSCIVKNASDNLLSNNNGQGGYNNWIFSNKNSFKTYGAGFKTSYSWGTKEQTIDLVTKGIGVLKQDRHRVLFSSKFFDTYCSPDVFMMEIELKDENGNILKKYSTGKTKSAYSGCYWQNDRISNVYQIVDVPSGVRYITYRDGGSDTESWGGYYGIVIKNATLKVGTK